MGALPRHRFAYCLLLSVSALVCAQTNPPTPAPVPTDTSGERLKPAAAYKAAMRPLEVVRSTMDNWSDAELGAFATGMHMAQQACAQIQSEQTSGDDLYDLARLCSLGQSWQAAEDAARRYIAGNAEPYRTQAYALSLNAEIRMGKRDSAIETAGTMLRTLTYDAEVFYALRYLKTTLELDGRPELLWLMETEHSHLLDALRTGELLKAVHGDAVTSIAGLYESAAQEAFYRRLVGDEAGAAAWAAECDSTLNKSTLPVEDRQQIEKVRAQFNLIGAPLPPLTILRSYQQPPSKGGPSEPPAIRTGAATVLVLFPEWCAQCRRMMKTVTAFAAANADSPIPSYGLMYSDGPDDKALHEQSEKDLAGTVTFAITPESAAAFHPLDLPMGIVLDSAGKIRYVGQLSGDAFNGGGYIEIVLKRIAVLTTLQKLAATPGR